MSRLNELALELLGIPSAGPNSDELTNHLYQWANSLRQFPHDLIFHTENDLILGRPDGIRPCIAFVGHTNSHSTPNQTTNPEIVGDQLIGHSASEIKGALAIMQLLCEQHANEELPFCLVFIFCKKQHSPSNSNNLLSLLTRYNWLEEIDAAVVMEPTDNTLTLGALGEIQARVDISGTAAPAAQPWYGENALHKAGPLLVELSQYTPSKIEIDGLAFHNCMEATMITGGQTSSIVPRSCSITLNYFFAPTLPHQEAVENAKKEIRRICNGAPLEFEQIKPPGPIPTQNPVLSHFREFTSIPMAPGQSQTAIADLSSHGIDSFCFGPGSPSQCHQEGEYASISMLNEAYNLLERVITTPMIGA